MVPEAGGDSPSELRQGEAAMRMGGEEGEDGRMDEQSEETADQVRERG